MKSPTRRTFRRLLQVEALEDRAVPTGVPTTATLSGVAFVDSNFNGKYDPGETLLAGVQVSLSGTSSLNKTVSQSTATDQNGLFQFQNVPNGTYQITFGAEPGYLSGGAVDGTLSGPEGETVVSGIKVSNGQASTENVSFLGLAPEAISLRLFLSSTTSADYPGNPAGAGTTGATGPTLKIAITTQTLTSTTPQYVDLAGYFTAPDITNGTQVALGITYNTYDATTTTFTPHTATVNVVLDDADAPQTVANFLDYCENNRYVGTVFHRSVTSSTLNVLQGGGYTPPSADGATTLTDIVTSADPIVPDEVKLDNSKYTIAMANAGANTATSQFYFNMTDNPSLDSQDAYTVFGQVTSAASQQVLNTLFAIPVTDVNSSFSTVPLVGYSSYTGTAFPSNSEYYLQITSVAVTNQNENLTYTASSSNTSVVAASFPADHPEQLELTPAGAGTSTITVTAKDQYGNTTSTTFQVTVPETATSLKVSGPTAAAQAGTPFGFTVTVENQFNNPDTSYTGTVHFTSTDTASGVVLPPNYTFTAANNGVSNTLDATLETSGSTITATDTVTSSLTGTSPAITLS